MNNRSFPSFLLILLFSLTTIISCKKDIKEDQPGTNPLPGNAFAVPVSTPVTGSVSGIVVNENNEPVDGAEVKLGITTTTTDARGLFSFNNATLDKYITTVTINLPGYFKAYRSFSANATRNYLNIKLIPKVVAGTLNSGSGGVVSLSNGSALTFQSNSIVIKSSGLAYTGSVNVYASYIDPTASDISAVVPGSFMGSDGSNMYVLQSTGMIAVDLESDAGEPLQLKSNLPATMKLSIPSSLLSKAPATIDTWSLDERGIWKKEGTATKNGNYYEFQATHFSFWNCDVPGNAVYLNLHLQDQNGNALANTLVQLAVTNNNSSWGSAYGLTDNLGNVSGLVPTGLELQLNIYSGPYSCQTPLYTQLIGPFNANATLNVTASIAQSDILSVIGTALDCNGAALQNGTALIYIDQQHYYYATIANGSYAATITHCYPVDSLSVTVMDNSSSNLGSSGFVFINATNITVPPIHVCDAGQDAIFELSAGYGNDCIIGPWTATYTVIPIMVNVIGTGNYNISTNTANGISYSASGTFTSIGQQYVNLVSSGTPVNQTNYYTYIPESMGVPGCDFMANINGTPPPVADIDINYSPCSSIDVDGVYTAGWMLYDINTVTLTINVISIGTYRIATQEFNGFGFEASGVFNSTGPTTVVLHVINWGAAWPIDPGTFIYQLESMQTGQTGCTFEVQVGQ